MKVYDRSKIGEFLGDRVVYRSLAPQDGRLPGLGDVRQKIGLPEGVVPRKQEPDYARVVVEMIRAARALGTPVELRRLLYVGDTRLGDGTAFENLCAAGGWQGAASIIAENSAPATREVIETSGGQTFYLTNRWEALPVFDQFCASQGLVVDEATVVVLDIDKTCLGARGRNAGVIDAARVRAIEATVAGLLGPAYDPQAFRTAYTTIDQPEFHPFTTDNQDYVAYVCLILGSGLYHLDWLVSKVRSEQLRSFGDFLRMVNQRAGELPAGLADLHADILERVQKGDPTPFKAFRRREYLETVARMGNLPDSAAVETLLREEIVITQEVRSMALAWQERGALLFGLSDKPDEAAVPGPDLAAQGYRPIHQVETHAVGT